MTQFSKEEVAHFSYMWDRMTAEMADDMGKQILEGKSNPCQKDGEVPFGGAIAVNFRTFLELTLLDRIEESYYDKDKSKILVPYLLAAFEFKKDDVPEISSLNVIPRLKVIEENIFN